jgi:hypothetical protein
MNVANAGQSDGATAYARTLSVGWFVEYTDSRGPAAGSSTTRPVRP